jgi:hypothetical protein
MAVGDIMTGQARVEIPGSMEACDLTITEHTVFVLGAGFTRAFLDKAPLIVGDYGVSDLLVKCRGLLRATRLIESEQEATNRGGQINMERLMTRLVGRMPYDASKLQSDELEFLLSEVRTSFRRCIESGTARESVPDALQTFAALCVNRHATCVTFNYDDLLDEALFSALDPPPREGGLAPSKPYWHPNNGYGFPCRPAASSFGGHPVLFHQLSTLLLKLHGSLNWFPRLGALAPLMVDALVHHERWYRRWPEERDLSDLTIRQSLENEPFIIPPVLTKSALVEEPILRRVWSEAHIRLSQADNVIFIGYSLPDTDLAARFLFNEAIRSDVRNSHVRVISLAQDSGEIANIKRRYRELFPRLEEQHFCFAGAEAWISAACAKVLTAPTSVR